MSAAVREVGYSDATVTARKRHRCDDFYTCEARWIEPGDEYIRAVAFPGSDANNGTQPWVMRVCVPCWRRYDADKPMPPRRKKRRTTDEGITS